MIGRRALYPLVVNRATVSRQFVAAASCQHVATNNHVHFSTSTNGGAVLFQKESSDTYRTVKSEAKKTMNRMEETGKQAKDYVEEKAQQGMNRATEFKDTLGDKWEDTKDAASNDLKSAWKQTKDLGERAYDKASDVASDMKQDLTEKKEQAKERMEDTAEVAAQKLKAAGRASENVWESTKHKAEDVWESAKDRAENFWEATKDKAEDVKEAMDKESTVGEKVKAAYSEAIHGHENSSSSSEAQKQSKGNKV